MNIKERLLQFIDYKALNKRKFCEKISVSHTYINDLKTMQSDKLEKISDIFPDLDLVWLITGKGTMIVDHQPKLVLNDHQAVYKTDKDITIELLKETIADKQKIIEMLEQQMNKKTPAKVT